MRYPLTAQQRWLWDLIEQYPGWNCAVSYAFRLKGHLRIPVLQCSLQELIRRHGALRSRVVRIDAGPELDIDESCDVRLDVVPVAEENAQQAFADFADRSVDPTADALFGLRLLVLAPNEHWLVVAMHRLMADCFSAEQVFRELWELYRALARDQASPLPTAAPQYGDYAMWQQKTEPDWQRRHEPYWTGRLEGAESLRWPVGHVSSPVVGDPNGRMNIHFGASLSEELQELAKHKRSLAAVVMLTVYVAVLWRWCGQKDFVIPFNIAGRQAEHKNVVGYFSHVLYLRISLTGSESFGALLGMVGNEFFRALAHQDFGRMALRRPDLLTGVFFQWTAWHPDAALEFPGSAQGMPLEVERIPLRDFAEGISALPPGTVDVDVTFFDTLEGIYAQGVYRRDRFSGATIDRLMRDLKAATALFVRNPEATVADCCEEGLSLEPLVHEI